jgi:hypothetical protein
MTPLLWILSLKAEQINLPKVVIASPTGNRNALVGIAGCITIPACAGMTTML